ncbi:MAG: hypothetical protein IPO63_02980 [Bacteroidetes bacterium]|nr:hypothetical protein [Bacteroidota bacterium]
MNKHILTILLSVLSITVLHSQSVNSGLIIANCVLSSLKNGNDSMILHCIPTNQEFIYIKETAETVAKKPEPSVDSLIKNITIGALITINKIHTHGLRKQIDWSLVKIDSVLVLDLKPEFEKIKKANIIVYLSQENIRFSLKLTRCLFITNAWRIMDTIIWRE